MAALAFICATCGHQYRQLTALLECYQDHCIAKRRRLDTYGTADRAAIQQAEYDDPHYRA